MRTHIRFEEKGTTMDELREVLDAWKSGHATIDDVTDHFYCIINDLEKEWDAAADALDWPTDYEEFQRLDPHEKKPYYWTAMANIALRNAYGSMGDCEYEEFHGKEGFELAEQAYRFLEQFKKWMT